ncbi:hypothetical protein AAC387_Pa08g0922 [Persea americana]
MAASSSSCLLLRLHTLLDEQRGIATIINDEIGAAVDSSVEAPISAPLVLLEGVSLPGEDNGRVTGDGGGGMELGGKDVAGAPADLDSEGGEGFDEDDGLDGHVEGAEDSRAPKGLNGPNSMRQAMRLGISTSASLISSPSQR